MLDYDDPEIEAQWFAALLRVLCYGGVPYQSLINLYLRDCLANSRKVQINWPQACLACESTRSLRRAYFGVSAQHGCPVVCTQPLALTLGVIMNLRSCIILEPRPLQRRTA